MPIFDHALPIFNAILVKMVPLYAVMALGFLYGRLRPNAVEPLSFLLIYILSPIVIGGNIANMDFQRAYLLLPFLILGVGCLTMFLSYQSLRHIFRDNTANIFGYSCAASNWGYIGLPVAAMIFQPNMLGVFMMAGIGFSLLENTLGYYLIARGNFTMRDSLRKLVRLPTIYAAIIAIIFNAQGHHLPDFTQDILRDCRGSMIVIGSLLIGIGLSRLGQFVIDWRLIASVFSLKFLVWPALALGFIELDRAALHLFTADIHKILILMSILPLPANTIPLAIQLNVQPDKASTLVFLTTLFALAYVPFVMAVWG